MQLAKVVGSVVATVKDPALESRTLLVLQPIAPSGAPSGASLVAIDGVGVGVGEEVLFVKGREAAFAFLPDTVLADASIVGKVDSVDFDHEGSGARPPSRSFGGPRRRPPRSYGAPGRSSTGEGRSPEGGGGRAPKK